MNEPIEEFVDIKGLACGVYDLIKKCRVDPGENTHSFRIKDAIIDIMFRRNMMVAVTFDRPGPEDEETDEDQEIKNEDLEIKNEESDEESDEEQLTEKDEESDEEQLTEKDEESDEEQLTEKDEESDEEQLTEKDEEQLTEKDEEQLTEKDEEQLTEKDEEQLTEKDEEQLTEKDFDHPNDTVKELLDYEWTTICSKKSQRQKKKTDQIKIHQEQQDNSTFYFFRDDANSSFIEFVGMVKGLTKMKKLAEKEEWSHGYCIETSIVYDFNIPFKSHIYRSFHPNLLYLSKFTRWHNEYEASGKKISEDTKELHFFKQASTWHEWKYVGKFNSLQSVRKIVKQKNWDWAHAYNIKDNDLYNFCRIENRLSQKLSKAPVKYIQRFEEFNI
jgi:chemotaxis protein histidine kinase CheA